MHYKLGLLGLVILIRICMSGVSPIYFSQVETSQGYFTKWQLPICATSQVCPNCSAYPQPILAAVHGPLTHTNRSALPPLQTVAPQRALS